MREYCASGRNPSTAIPLINVSVRRGLVTALLRSRLRERKRAVGGALARHDSVRIRGLGRVRRRALGALNTLNALDALDAFQAIALGRFRWSQFAHCSSGSLVALLLHAGDLFLPFLKRCTRTCSHNRAPKRGGRSGPAPPL